MASISLFAAGSNARGQLATGDTEDAHQFFPCIFTGYPPNTVPNHVVAVEQIACGANHTLALLRSEDGNTELWGSGDGTRGQLGPSYAASTEKESENARAIFRPLDLPFQIAGVGSLDGFTVRLIAAGWETSYVVLSRPEHSDVLLSMGANDFGNLGLGASPSTHTTQGVHAVDLVSVLPSDVTRSGVTLKILSLSTGPHHTVVRVSFVFPDGSSRTSLAGWGTSRHGQLGPILNASGRPSPSTPSPHHLPVDSPKDITAITLGNQHTVCLRSSGRLHALGSNRKDQLAGLDSLSGVTQVGCTWNGTYVLLESGQVLATGSNTHSQLGRGSTGTHSGHGTLAPVSLPIALGPGQITRLVCGSEHVLCIVKRSLAPKHESQEQRPAAHREVWGWGWNEHGNLGIGGTDDAGVPVKVWPPEHVGATGESTSGRHGDGEVLNVWAGCGTSFLLVRGRSHHA